MPPPDQQVEIDFPPSLIEEPEVHAVPVLKHEKYYLDDGDFYALAENTLFRVHVHFLSRHSGVIKEELQSPCPTGMHEDDAFVLKDVTVEDFALLLWVFYDKSLERQASGDEWLRILFAAEKLQMPHVQNLALDRLKGLSVSADPILIISVQQKYRNTISRAWARDAFVQVCERQGRLTVEEGERIGILASVLIGHVREEDLFLRSQPQEVLSADCYGNPCSYAMRPTVRDIVQRIIIQDEPPTTPPQHEVLDDSKPFECNVEGANRVVVYAGQHVLSVHRHFLEQHSPLISHMLRPVTPRQEHQWDMVEGSNATITLNVDGLHFSWVLWLLYNESLLISPSIEQWSAIHVVAKQYKMDLIGAYATKRMGNTLDLVERVLSIQRFSMQDQWAKDTYDIFYQREEPISAEEGERLGFKTWAELNARRELFLRNMWEECQCQQTECLVLQPMHPITLSSAGKKLKKKKK